MYFFLHQESPKGRLREGVLASDGPHTGIHKKGIVASTLSYNIALHLNDGPSHERADFARYRCAGLTPSPVTGVGGHVWHCPTRFARRQTIVCNGRCRCESR
ncbi:hypothetical protein EMIT0194P_10511 [Pseudomonas serbica]